MAKTGIELYEERKKRVLDAIALKQPDKVPIMLGSSFLAAKYAGITYQEAMSDQEKWLEANKNLFKNLIQIFISQQVSHSFFRLQCLKLWVPNIINGLAMGRPNVTYQYVEMENMKQDEYDHFLDDPTDFLIRVYLPRVFEKLEGFRLLPSLKILSLSK